MKRAVEFDVVLVDALGQEMARSRQSAAGWTEEMGEDIQLDLVEIPGGTILIGSPKTEEGWHLSQNPQQSVSVESFWMSQYPITQSQWKVIAKLPAVERPLNPEPSCFSGQNRPVEQISWHDAVEFCARLSQKTGDSYRLPSEAEWEYACRATTQTPFHVGETITTDLANYSGVNWEYEGRICSKGFYGQGPTGRDRRETTEVGSFGIANAFGLYDMHGLVREWCADCWHDTYDGIPTDGTAWTVDGDRTQRVLRGGSWNTSPRTCRSAFRSRAKTESTLYDIGFRVVRQRS